MFAVFILLIINTLPANSQSNSKKISLEEIETLPLIETHCHVGITGKASFENLKDLQEEENIAYALIIGKDINGIINNCSKYPEETGALLWINPGDTINYKNLLTTISKNSNVVKGIKLHPNVDHYLVSSELLDSVFWLVNKKDILLVSHTSDTKWSKAEMFAPLMQKYPNTKFILYHATPLDDCIKLVNKYSNVFIDVSYTAWGKEIQQKALAEMGKEKILFGIDSPLGFKTENDKFLPHYRDAAREVAGFYDFDRDVVEHVLYKNAAKLLGVNIPE